MSIRMTARNFSSDSAQVMAISFRETARRIISRRRSLGCDRCHKESPIGETLLSLPVRVLDILQGACTRWCISSTGLSSFRRQGVGAMSRNFSP